MEPVSNVDRLILLLRQRLLERSKAARAQSKGTGRVAPDAGAGGVDRLQALAAVEGLDDHQLNRALVQNLLADQLGEELINDAKFQQVVDRVTQGLERDPGLAILLQRVVGELRAQG